MKKILISSVLAMAVLSSACEDNLDIPQKGVTAIENFYQTDDDAEQAMVAAYQGFQWNVCGCEGASIYVATHMVFNQCGDDVFAAGEFLGDNDFLAAMNEFRYDTDNAVVKTAYNNYYYAMYYSNLVIDKFKDGLPKVGHTAVSKRVVAEARVLRAYIHMMLAIGWCNPPKVDHVFTGSEVPVSCPHDELLLWCAQECEEAVADLDERKAPTDKNGAAKVTKGLAWSIAGKCYLFLKDYAKCKAALKNVINSNKYELVPGERFAENFHIEGDLNEEKIFESNFDNNTNLDPFNGHAFRSSWMESNIWGWRSSKFVTAPNATYSSIDGWGGCGVPKSFADEFVANDGVDSYRLKASIASIEDVVYGRVFDYSFIDKETNETVALSSLTDAQKASCKYIGLNQEEKGLYGQSLYLPLKPVVKATDLISVGQNIRLNNYTVMRYAEVLLMYAEACLQTGDAAEAKTYINMIQKRAGSKTISDNVDMNVLKREKKLELWLEGNRWADMCRWEDFELAKKAGTEVTEVFDSVFRPKKSSDKVVDESGRFYSVLSPDAQGRATGFQAGKHEWFPIPLSVRSLNPDLPQNPGW